MEVVGSRLGRCRLGTSLTQEFELMEHGFKAEQEFQQQYHSAQCQQVVRNVSLEYLVSLPDDRNFLVSLADVLLAVLRLLTGSLAGMVGAVAVSTAKTT